MNINELIPYENNPRINEAAVDAVANSIKEFGFKVPIIIDKNNVIVAGHTRLKAAQKLGLEEVPVIIADDLTDEQVKAFRLADNKVGELAEWDFSKLEEELKNIEMDMSPFDFDMKELSKEFDKNKEVVEDDFDVDEAFEQIDEPITQQGDVWLLGNHRLMCGDSTSKDDVETLMNGQKADLVFTDPPYGMNAVSKSGVLSKTYGTDIMNDDTNEVAINSFLLVQKMFAESKQVWWGANYYTECLPSSECWVVWDKNNGESDQTDCELAYSNFRSVVRQFTMASEKINRVHPTQKPVKLIQQILNKFDKQHEFLKILDLFGGSGSTLIACEQLDRKCYMMELDPKYCDVIIQRWETLTGEKAKLDGVE